MGGGSLASRPARVKAAFMHPDAAISASVGRVSLARVF